MVDPARHHRGLVLCTDPAPGACRDTVAPLELLRPGLHLRALVVHRRKIIRDVERGSLSAFDLERDPRERRPLSPVPPDLVAALNAWEEHGFSADNPLIPLLP